MEIEKSANWESGSGGRRVRVFVEPDRGQSDAINKGMRLATGEIVGWLNVDHVLMPGALSKVADAFNQNPNAVVVCQRPENAHYWRLQNDAFQGLSASPVFGCRRQIGRPLAAVSSQR